MNSTPATYFVRNTRVRVGFDTFCTTNLTPADVFYESDIRLKGAQGNCKT